MKSLRLIGMIITFVLVAFTVTPALKAGNDVWNKKTVMTFTQPFEIPGGQVLPAGTYVFKLLDSQFDRDIVQIFNEDQTHAYATILAIPNHRLNATDETVINFEERAAGSPQAIKAWFHPSERWGHEFVYGKARAQELAKITNEPVPSMPAEALPEITLPVKSAKDAPVVALESAPITAAEPSGQETTVAEAFPPAQLEVEAKNLPATASELPLIGLMGLLSVAAGFALTLAKRVS